MLAPIVDPAAPDRLVILKERYAELAGYLAGVRAWIVDAKQCLESP